MGANIISGGNWHDTNYGGFFYKPTFIEKVNPQMPVYNEEVFGPVINVDTFDDDEEAIKKLIIQLMDLLHAYIHPT